MFQRGSLVCAFPNRINGAESRGTKTSLTSNTVLDLDSSDRLPKPRDTMAKEYFEKLSRLVDKLNLKDEITGSIDVKHFFNGAAFYVDGSIRASWSPAGLAFKLPEAEVAGLIKSGKAEPFKYFEKGHIKKSYALFKKPAPTKRWKSYFIKASQGT